MINETKFPCKDEKEITKRREALKKSAKLEGVFLYCEGNSVICKNDRKYTFEVKDEIPDIEEPLPPGAFDEAYQRRAQSGVVRDIIAAKAARDMLE